MKLFSSVRHDGTHLPSQLCRQTDYWSPRVQDQPGQQSNTVSAKKRLQNMESVLSQESEGKVSNFASGTKQ